MLAWGRTKPAATCSHIIIHHVIYTYYMRSIIMNKVSVFCLLVSLFAFGSCHDDEETQFGNKVYVDFPNIFDVPAEGGKFLIKQTYNNDYFLSHCEASINHVDSNGKITVSYDSIQSHDTTFVYGMVRFILIQIVFTTVGLS